jgi:predicted kinase
MPRAHDATGIAATAASPPPLLVIVSGKPSSGKSTLARRLAERDALGLPLLSRDAIKVGLVETHANAETGARRWTVETDALRATIVPRSYAIFYQTIEAWLRAGVSLIAEYGFVRGRSESDLRPLIKLAWAVVVHCVTSPEEARRRFIARERSDPHSRPDRLGGIIEQMEKGTFGWSASEAMDLDIPMLHVDTTRGYVPVLDVIVAFCRGSRTSD